MSQDLVAQLHALGIRIAPTDQIFRTGSELHDDGGIGSAIPQEVHFMNAELRNCEILGVGVVPCLFSGSGHVYEFVRTLRKCIYGKVKHAVELTPHPNGSGVFVRTNLEVAIKVMSKAIIEQGNLQENPMVELATQQYLSTPGHPNVLPLLECLHDPEFIYAVLPFCKGGELFSLVESGGAMDEGECRHWFAQVLNGLSYLQHRLICHRDMSLENVLLDGSISKIIDFGLCIGIPVDAQGMTYSLPPAGAVGKIFYMPPEIYRNQVPFNGFAADIWSTGVMLFIMVTGAPPFERPDDVDPRFQMIATGRLNEMLDSWGMHHVSRSVRDLLNKMLVVHDPRQRLTVEQIAQHPWVLGQH
ncbi:CAMK protein kinase [Saprolegnia diclina VS20]|uniref:CAMK protein kinase n=1 Tax=Saprolegnia diclina (strain VS20) TaxID=1156394 RepID=T0Q384_SAPDV|nr:CAMK protein kinase [Saprolegnia diclina VS20]EQC29006.1 CAMK protein kinase [Saprolegnia diclina VS20]|eukprot:XP_008617645.1 CAMK protein kinase [Saprolegnia diclina VS20]